MVFFGLGWEDLGFSGIATGTLGTLSDCLREVRSLFELWGARGDSSQVVARE